jgi:hypothetical protein
LIVDLASREKTEAERPPRDDSGKDPAAVSLGRRGGLKRGAARAWMRRFNGVATRYLDSYLGWRRMIERLDATISLQAILLTAR